MKDDSQQHAKHIILVKAYRKLNYICVIYLLLSIVKKSIVYMLIQ